MEPVHDLRTDPAPFAAVVAGYKTFEMRWDDRGFKLGDTLRLLEWIPPTSVEANDGRYTGREVLATVTYILRAPKYGLREKWCVMSFKKEQ